jgi:FtsP/CotA-like multicopper oxidase with cupredoxin domain
MGAFVQTRNGRITLATTILVGIIVLLFVFRSTGPALATAGGSPYVVPLAVDTNTDPDIFETTISAVPAMVDIGNGVMASALTFNGTLPGPELRLKVGDTVIVHFENHIAHPTGIHWHGIELSNASDGTPLTQNQVPPNGKFLYKFKVTRPGIYWYHPHHHSSTNQVFKGLYGTIIITDPNDTALQASGVLPPASQTMTMALSDTTVCKASGQNSAKAESLCITAPIDEDGVSRLPSPPGAGPFNPGDIPNIQLAGISGTVNEGEIVLTNGKNVGGRAGAPDDNPLGALDPGAATFDVVAGQGLRLQIGSEATVRFFRLRLTGSDGTNTIQIPLVRVGGEGGLLDHAVVEGGVVSGFDFKYGSGEVLLDPGDRVDVVAVFPPTATGVFTLWTSKFQRQGSGQTPNLPTVPVAHFNVVGSAGNYTIGNLTPLLTSIGQSVETLPAPTGSLLDPSTFAPTKPGTNNPDVQLTNTGGPAGLGINNVLGEHDFPGDYTAVPRPINPMTMASSARYAKLGDVLQLTVTNQTGAHHPFHLHGFSIQPISLTDTMPGPPPAPNASDASPGTGPPYTFPYREFRDNIDVPAGYTLTFRVRLDDRPQMDGITLGGGLGRWVFHCHIFFHASFGMISEFDVVDSTGNERPYVNANTDAVTVNEGQVASMNGTFSDPDMDSVTLSASIGTVTPGAGTWSWSYTTTDGPDENQVVTIKATDTNGNKSDVAFALNVNNLPPSVSISSPAPNQLFQLADLIPVTAPFTDPGTGDTHTCAITWESGVTTAGTVVEAAGSGTCTGTHTYATGGLKTIIVRVTDDDGGLGSASVTIDVNSPPDCSPVTPNPNTLWAPNHVLETITISGATDPDGDTVTLTINTVTQDEPINGLGDGDTSPDAALVAGHSDQVQLRSERSGKGDGRVYRIGFGGSDGRGGTCSATVNTTVDKSKGLSGTAIDSGLVFNSF